MRLSDFDFELPEELIAQFPLEPRSSSRLLHLDREGRLFDRAFCDLKSLLRPNDLLVFNDTRVIKARLYGSKPTGGRIEVLIERIVSENRALANIRASHGPKPGSVVDLGEGLQARVLRREDEFYLLEFEIPVIEALDRHGLLPLPPYISRAADDADLERYQTVYAREPGAVAAPTAGLHFDSELLSELARLGVSSAFVTLHVGAGTFKPVRVESIHEHRMHSEVYNVPPEAVAAIDLAKSRGGRVIAVGTTSLRALESAAATGKLVAGMGETSIFITPGYEFKVVDLLLTNFHLPKSTLFMLVCAFGGFDRLRAAYAHAILQKYRFFSYGDAMLIERKAP